MESLINARGDFSPRAFCAKLNSCTAPAQKVQRFLFRSSFLYGKAMVYFLLSQLLHEVDALKEKSGSDINPRKTSNMNSGRKTCKTDYYM